MRTGYSPYDMTTEATRLISEATASHSLSLDCEKQIIALLNTAETYPDMSTYQLSLAHKAFADLYYTLEITGSAIKHYEIAIKLNPKIAVKKKLKLLRTLPIEALSYSLDANIASEPDYSHLTSYKMELDVEFIENRNKQIEKIASSLGMDIETYNKMHENAIEELQKEVDENNKIYDPEWEKEIEERLSKLGDLPKKRILSY